MLPTAVNDDRDKPTPDWTRPPEPPIHRAARKGDHIELARLLAAGADINERADLEHDNGPYLKGLTTLMVAARSIDGASVDTLRWLIEHGADPHARSEGGITTAWYAAGHGGRWDFHKQAVTPDHVDRLRYLLDLGLDPTERNFIGRSLMTEACEAGDPARVALLLQRGAHATVTDFPPILQSPMRRTTESLESGDLDERADSPIGAGRGFQIPLFCAARSGSAECLRLLLNAGVDPHTRDSSGGTALMSAGSAAVVRVLLEAGVDRDAVDQHGKDAFEAVLEESCSAGACGPERFEVAKALVEAGVDIERVDKYGKTRLASAAFGHHADAVDFLLKLGARADARDSEGSTPLHGICWQGEYQDPDINLACERIIRSLVAAGVPVDATDDHGQTAMHEAAGGDWGNQTAIRTLLALGAAVDPRDNNGSTPLMIAASNGAKACIELLCEAGADPKRPDNDGRSALDEAKSHLDTWRNITASGPDVSMAEMQQQMHEELAREFGTIDDAPVDLPSLLDEQSSRHESALRDAQEAFDVLRRATSASGSDG